MICIRSDQWSSMARHNFLDRIEALIRANLPAETSERLDVRRVAEHCVAAAEGYALTGERAVAAFVLHMLSISPEFHLQPGIRAILDDRGADDAARMERLLTDASESDWEEAVRMCDLAVYWRPFLGPAPGTA